MKNWKKPDKIHYEDLSEIAWKMGYSSVAHLSSQFKRTTGMTANGFKETGINHRKPLDKV